MTDKTEQLSDMGAKMTAGADFEPLAAGNYDFVVHGIVGLGCHEKTYEGKPIGVHPRIKIIFELPSEVRNDEQTQVTSYKTWLSVSPKSGHFKFCKMFVGQDVETNTAKYVSAAGLKELLGKTGVLTIRHWNNEGNNVALVDKDGFFPLDPRLPKPVATRELFFFNPLSPNLKVFAENLSYYTQKEVMSAVNVAQFPEELKELWRTIEEEQAKKGKDKPMQQQTSAPWKAEGDNQTASIE